MMEARVSSWLNVRNENWSTNCAFLFIFAFRNRNYTVEIFSLFLISLVKQFTFCFFLLFATNFAYLTLFPPFGAVIRSSEFNRWFSISLTKQL